MLLSLAHVLRIISLCYIPQMCKLVGLYFTELQAVMLKSTREAGNYFCCL